MNGVDPSIDAISISFKDTVTLNGFHYVLVICDTKNGYQHGHTFGCTNYFFLTSFKNTWFVKYSILHSEPDPLGDNPAYEIVAIGKDKRALVSYFESTGNHHYEKSLALYYIQEGTLTPVFYLDSEYSNVAWKLPESVEDPCNGYREVEEYVIVPSNQQWYDIHVKKSSYNYGAGCEEEILKQQIESTYRYINTKYSKVE